VLLDEVVEEDSSRSSPSTFFFLLGWALSFSVVRSARSRPQKETPRFFYDLLRDGGWSRRAAQAILVFAVGGFETFVLLLESCTPNIVFRDGCLAFG